MQHDIGRFEADGSDGRVYTVLVYAGGAAPRRLATAEGLTVVPHGPSRYYAVLSGVRLTPRAAAPAGAPA